VCTRCGTAVEPDATIWRCPRCGGPFTFAELDVAPPASLPAVTMGEGNTSLATARVGGRDVLAKLEFEAPTGSFKDRGTALLIAAAVDVGSTRVVADSSGNAGVAIAAYAARAGLACEVFVSSALATSKTARIAGDVITVKGTREDVAAAAVARVEESGAFYASHVWNPWFYEGTKRYVYELFDQLGGRLPDALVLPVGNGTLVLGAWRALQELGRTTPIIGVQAARCAPIAAAFSSGADQVAGVIDQGTVAAGIAIAAPVRGDEILAIVRATGGWFVTVTDDEITAASSELSGQGFAVEPTAAAPAAALQHLDIEDVVIPIAAGSRAE
jgi:threonine synthase